MELIVDGVCVKLKDRQALEDLRTHRQRSSADLKVASLALQAGAARPLPPAIHQRVLEGDGLKQNCAVRQSGVHQARINPNLAAR
jgi:hypothetical protein